MSEEPPFSPDQIEAIFFDLDGTLMDTDDQSVGYWEQRLITARLRREQANRIARYLITALEKPAKLHSDSPRLRRP